MAVYRIAELNIQIEPLYEDTAKRLEPYKTNESNFDFEVHIQKAEVAKKFIELAVKCSYADVEGALILEQICNVVLEKFDGFFFHSSSLFLDGKAFLFTAKSGVGKSTQTALWCKHFGNRVTMINDDKPIVRRINGKFYVFGTPWMGKSDIGNNISAQVDTVYVLLRSAVNSAEKVKTGKVFKQIFEATVIPQDRVKMSKLLELLDDFLSHIKLIELKCNMSDNAVVTAYEASQNFYAEDND